jgi:lipopolysaccharide/colanic/teichoic acid biosynthesis glycosyltransferase
MKSVFDIISSALGILLLLPLLALIAILVKIDSRGPIFYRQIRVGKQGEVFKILKYRTMKVGADRKGLLTVGDRDNRVTKIGYYLRKSKLDELPQLFNVLFGQMSIVGPRPEVPKYVEMYSDDDRIVLSVKPGITDYASIEFRNENELLKNADNPEEMYIHEILPLKLALNKKYIHEKSWHNDLLIILKTITVIFKKR